MEVVAEWPGVVAEVRVGPGDRVAAEDELLIIESMKMLTPVTSPSAGIVDAVHVEAGQFVDEGAPLLTLSI
jgi:biotin carboxyl carrier protein